MSIFEQRTIGKVYLDDTHPLTCSIINSEKSHGYTEYVIRVQRGPSSEHSWLIYKRYNDFYNLNQSLQGCGFQLPLPPKRLIGNFEREFIAERQAGLQVYLDIILRNPILSSHFAVKKFLDPENYASSVQDLTLAQMCIALRGELDIVISKPLPDIGWRIRKKHFLCHLKSDPKHEAILSWAPFGPDKVLEEKQIQSCLKALSTLQHVNIVPIEFSGVCEEGVWVIKNLNKSGSLLDLLSGVKNPYYVPALKKYTNNTLRKPVPPEKVMDIASQILQGLAYLHHKGIPYGHLHLGNLRLEDGVIKLMDVENSVLGLPPYYRPYLIEHRFSSFQSIDIYCLGLVMYELLFGEPFTSVNCHAMPLHCSPVLRPILESILTVEGVKNGIPTISTLLNTEIFRRTPPKPHPYIKMSGSTKQFFQNAGYQIIERLKEDHKKVREHKRALKLQEFLDSEEKKPTSLSKRKSSKRGSKADLTTNGKWGDRSGSPTSSSTTGTSAGTSTPPAPPPPAPPPPPPPPPLCDSSPQPTDDKNRVALLSDICNFNKGALKKVQV